MDFIFFYVIKVLDYPFFRPLHWLIQKLELLILGPLAFFYILKNHPAQVVYRHSILEKKCFHFLLSDLDVSIIFRQDISLAQLEEIKARYEKIKTIFPFLGEMEIFTQVEYQEWLSLKESQSHYQWLRWLRKLTWIDDSLLKTSSRWRIFKAKRARRITLEKMKLSVKEWLGLHFHRELELLQKADWAQKVKGQPPIWSDYLGYWISSVKMDGELPQINLEPEEIILLVALLPDQFVASPWLPEVGRQAREVHPFLEQIWCQNVQLELLHLKAWKRNLVQSSDWNHSWIQILSDWKKDLDNKLSV